MLKIQDVILISWEVRRVQSQLLLCRREKAGFLLGLPLQVLPLLGSYLTALGTSVSVSSLRSATSTEDIQFEVLALRGTFDQAHQRHLQDHLFFSN